MAIAHPITDIFIFPSSHTQLTIQGKIGYMLRLEEAIIRAITRIIKRKIKTASRFNERTPQNNSNKSTNQMQQFLQFLS